MSLGSSNGLFLGPSSFSAPPRVSAILFVKRFFSSLTVMRLSRNQSIFTPWRVRFFCFFFLKVFDQLGCVTQLERPPSCFFASVIVFFADFRFFSLGARGIFSPSLLSGPGRTQSFPFIFPVEFVLFFYLSSLVFSVVSRGRSGTPL